MNQRARELGLDAHALREPDRARRPGATTRRARDLVTLDAASCARNRSSAARSRTRSVTLQHRRPPAHARRTATRSCGRYRWVNGVKTGHTQQAGYVLVGSGQPQRRHADQRRARRRRATPRATPTRCALLRYGVHALPARAPGRTGRGARRARRSATAAAPSSTLVAGAHGAARRGRAAARHLRTVRPCASRPRSRARSRSGAASSARSTCCRGTAKRRDACRWSPPPTVPAAGLGAAHQGPLHEPAGSCSLVAVVALAGTVGSPAPPAVAPTAVAARAESRRPHDHHRHAQHGDRQDARRCRTSGSAAATAPSSRRTMPGGKGVNVARVLKTLGQPVIATGFAGGATGTRIVEQLTQESMLSRLRAHPRGVAHQHRGARPDDRRADRDQRARPAGHRAGGRAVPRQAALPRPGRERVRVRRLAAARRRHRRLRAADPRAAQRWASTTVVDTDGEPLRHAVRAEPDVVSPNVLEAEELVGHEFNDDEDRIDRRARDGRARRARGDHDVPDGCFARWSPEEPAGAARSTACAMRAGAVEPRATVGSGDAFLAGFVAAPLPRPRPRGVPALRRRLRRGVDPAPRRGPRRPRAGRAPARRGRGRALEPPAERLRASDARRFMNAVPARYACDRSTRRVPSARPLGSRHGNRDRPRQEGAPRLRLRRHRDRALAAHARPRRRRHLLEARALPLRAAAARVGDGRRRLAGDGRRSSASSAASPCSTSRAS